MIITDEIRKSLVGKKLICRGDVLFLTEGKAYKVLKTEEYENNQLKTLVIVLNDDEKECSYDLMWFVDKQKDEILYDKITYEQIEKSPIDGIELEYEKFLKDSLNNNEEIVTVNYDNYSDIFTYHNLPIISKYLMDVYDYCTELKNQVNYVDFNFAKMHMLNGDKAMFENETYYIKDGELYCEELNSACALKLRAIESDKWILL